VGVSPAAWREYSPDQKERYLSRLRDNDPEAYAFYKQAVEGAWGK
jgi:hypothetical protein